MPNIETRPLPPDALSACKCKKCGHVDSHHRLGCTNCGKNFMGIKWNMEHSDMEYGYFMPPDFEYVSCAELYLQGYRGEGEA